MFTATSAVIRHTQLPPTRKAVLLVYTDCEGKNGEAAYPSINCVMRRTGLSRRTVQRACRDLEAAGLLRPVGLTATGVVVKEVAQCADARGRHADAGGRHSDAQKQSEKQSDEEHQGYARAREASSREKPVSEQLSFDGGSALPVVRFNKKPVSPDVVRLGVNALDEFNRQTGQQLGAFNGRGEPSVSLTRVLGRLVDWPDLDAADLERIIRATLESKWWGQSRPSIGVVFGPMVWEDNMHRKVGETPKAQSRAERKDARNRARLERAWREQQQQKGEIE